MSENTSPITNLKYGVELVCKTWCFPRSSFYYTTKKQKQDVKNKRRGKTPLITDECLLSDIKNDLAKSPFTGEGHRKVHARLKRKKICVGRNRVLKLMREHKLLSPYRSERGEEKLHDGRITTDHPNEMWGTDATKVFTLEDGWIWCFSIIEHWNAECLGWHVTRKGDRFAAIEALNQSIENVFSTTSKGIARGVKLRVDHGSQFLSAGFVNQAHYWGINISKGFVREPETNGVIERFHRTFKEQIVHGRCYHSVMDFQKAVSQFIQIYNAEWLLEKLGHNSPLEARALYKNGINVLKGFNVISPKLSEQEGGHGYSVLTGLVDVAIEQSDNFTVSLHKEEGHGYSVLTNVIVA